MSSKRGRCLISPMTERSRLETLGADRTSASLTTSVPPARSISGMKATMADGRCPPPRQDTPLVESLRKLRPYGAVRFVVGCGGLVLTKLRVGRWPDVRWEARFVTRLNFRHWYPKES